MVGGCWGRGSAPRGGRRTVSEVRREAVVVSGFVTDGRSEHDHMDVAARDLLDKWLLLYISFTGQYHYGRSLQLH